MAFSVRAPAAVFSVVTAAAMDILGGTGRDGAFSTVVPDPSLLVWDPPPVHGQSAFRAGWLSVPVLHDEYLTEFERSPRRCLRVLMKPAAKQPAKLGPIMLHCGGPGSGAECALAWGKWLELNSTYLVGSPLSEDYDYWSISQRGMDQDDLFKGLGFDAPCPFKDERAQNISAWPSAQCHGIESLIAKEGAEAVLKRLDGSPDGSMTDMFNSIWSGADSQRFGVVFYNETYVQWLYRLMALEFDLCFNDDRYAVRSPVTNRKYNTLEHSGTMNLAYDIELFRRAIGAKKMSIYGVSYGTKVGSVYATLFPDTVHRLILDGDMGSDPDVRSFAGWVGQSTEAVWTGLSMACDSSVGESRSPQTVCPAGPGSTRKLYKILREATADKVEIVKAIAAAMFNEFSATIYEPGVPGAAHFMKCLATTFATGVMSDCHSQPGTDTKYPSPKGLETIAQVLGMDLAGRLTEQAFIEWWHEEKERQPLGLTRSLMPVLAIGVWPAVPRPHPPIGGSVVAPLIIGNLHDGQTPYTMAQRMARSFPSGRLLTSQFYGHGLQGPADVQSVVERYEDEMRRGVVPTYDNEVAKLLCVKVALVYLKDGTLPRDYVCKAAGPVQTGPGPSAVNVNSSSSSTIIV